MGVGTAGDFAAVKVAILNNVVFGGDERLRYHLCVNT